MLGTIKTWKLDRGFGFAAPDGGGPDVFVHVSAIVDGDELREGDRISFEMGTHPRSGKSCGENVRLIHD